MDVHCDCALTYSKSVTAWTLVDVVDMLPLEKGTLLNWQHRCKKSDVAWPSSYAVVTECS